MPKLKTATRLSLYAAFLIAAFSIGVYVIIFSAIQNELVKKSNEGAIKLFDYINEVYQANSENIDKIYSQNYFAVTDGDGKIIYANFDDNISAEYKQQFQMMDRFMSNVWYSSQIDASYYYASIDDNNQIGIKIIYFSSVIPTEQWRFWVLLCMLLFIGGIILFFISASVVDKILNPVRLMSSKIKSIGNKNFDERLSIDSAEDELMEFAEVFNVMAEKLNDYDKKQKRFISDASHELVTPITVINGHADLLLRWGKDDPIILKEKLSIIKTEALSMNALIEDLLFFARSDNKTLHYHFEQVNLRALLLECVEEQQLVNPKFFIHCDCHENIFVYADYSAIKRVFRILFANSVKFSVNEKEIDISVTKVKNIFLTFTDKGVGIPDEFLTSVFGRFFRVDDSRTKESGGTGLGLAIATEILSAHNGGIRALPNKCGTTIEITFFMESSYNY